MAWPPWPQVSICLPRANTAAASTIVHDVPLESYTAYAVFWMFTCLHMVCLHKCTNAHSWFLMLQSTPSTWARPRPDNAEHDVYEIRFTHLYSELAVFWPAASRRIQHVLL
jgi:hypothetical protein